MPRVLKKNSIKQPVYSYKSHKRLKKYKLLKPKRIIKMKIPKATVNPDKNVRSLFLPIVSKISLQRSLLNIGWC